MLYYIKYNMLPPLDNYINDSCKKYNNEAFEIFKPSDDYLNLIKKYGYLLYKLDKIFNILKYGKHYKIKDGEIGIIEKEKKIYVLSKGIYKVPKEYSFKKIKLYNDNFEISGYQDKDLFIQKKEINRVNFVDTIILYYSSEYISYNITILYKTNEVLNRIKYVICNLRNYYSDINFIKNEIVNYTVKEKKQLQNNKELFIKNLNNYINKKFEHTYQIYKINYQMYSIKSEKTIDNPTKQNKNHYNNNSSDSESNFNFTNTFAPYLVNHVEYNSSCHSHNNHHYHSSNDYSHNNHYHYSSNDHSQNNHHCSNDYASNDYSCDSTHHND